MQYMPLTTIFQSSHRNSLSFALLKDCQKPSQILILAINLFIGSTTAAYSLPAESIDPAPVVDSLVPILESRTTPGIILEGERVIPVGLNINGKNILQSINARGREDGEKAVNFALWIVPFDEVMAALKFKVDESNPDEILISSPLFKFKLSAAKLVKDRQLGRSISIKDLNTIPGLTAKFDINRYAIDLSGASVDRDNNNAIVDQPIILDGLPIVKPTSSGISGIQQRINTSGQNGTAANTQGELKIVGNVADANFYVRVDQSQFDRPKNWNISDGVVIRQRPQNDLVLGSQTPFWRRQGSQAGTYWGGTSIWREGFTPPVQLFGNDFLLNERLQSSRVGRSIVGSAAPGTLVQLVRGSQIIAVKEILVDSSGIYRFDNIIVGNGNESTFGQDYRVLLYPNGQLTSSPEIRTAQFVTTPGQIPAGSSALVVSAGGNRISSGNFGDFDAVQGGVLYRRGVSEELTLGVGTAFDRELIGIGEVFWQPSNTALQVAVSATTGKQGDLLGRFDYQPSPDFLLTGNLDQFSSRSNAEWRLNPNVTALANYDSRQGTSVGGRYESNNGRDSFTYIRAEMNNQAKIRFGASQRLNKWQLSHQSNESASNSQISYNIDRNPKSIDEGNQLVATHQTNSQATANISPYFSSLIWRYRSPERVTDGRSLWQAEFGYGLNNLGVGLVGAIDLNLIPGLGLRGSYRGVSENGRDSYSLEFTTNLLTNNGIQGTNSRIEDLRVMGSVELNAFFDTNSNSVQDAGEKSYSDPLLFKLNQKSVNNFQAVNQGNSTMIKLPPDSYLLNVDPAGAPVGYRSSSDSLRVDVFAGNVTKVAVPLVPAYIYTGMVQDRAGKPIPGAKVEVSSLKNKTKINSITNDSGIYYLEGLERGAYKLTVSGLSVNPDQIGIDAVSQPIQELNITVDVPSETVQEKGATNAVVDRRN